MRNHVIVLAAAVVVMAAHVSGQQLSFPHYKQCDPAWAGDRMGVPHKHQNITICQQGCAMTSVSMALAGLGARTPKGDRLTPASLNDWLRHNEGYTCAGGDCANLNLTRPERMAQLMTFVGELAPPPYDDMAAAIARGNFIFIAHVRHQTHFVLLTNATGNNTFDVLDPFFNNTNYTYGEIHDVIIFKRNKYPLYKQCGESWSNNIMGNNNDTICQVGCLMSSISSAMAGTGITIWGETVNPGTMNTWLHRNNGFWHNTSALEESVTVKVNPFRAQWGKWGMHTTNDLSFNDVVKMITSEPPLIAIANVMHGQHFVLVVGYRADGDTLVVNDSGFDNDTYSHSKDVVGWRVFKMV